MKKYKIRLLLISLLLLCAIAVNLSGCATKVYGTDLMAGISPRPISGMDNYRTENVKVINFALNLFRTANDGGENVLLSPLSIMCALAMTANGAKGETRAQMETLLGMSVERLNLYLYSYMRSLPESKNYELNMANSIWFTDDEGFRVDRDFLQLNADYYGAAAYQVPFDRQTVTDINNWVNRNTDKMIDKVIEEIPSDTVMYLINALAFEADWMRTYESSDVRTGSFTTADGEVKSVDMMYGSENKYIEDANAKGFIKYYKDGKYAFVALLPNEGISLKSYVSSLDGSRLSSLINHAEETKVKTAIPKFETEYDVELSGVLKNLGMSNAFDGLRADFSAMGESSNGNIYISEVIHKTYMQVGEKGTRAGAVTAVQMNTMSIELCEVYLNRPFVYMIIDCENNIPIFIGTMTDVG